MSDTQRFVLNDPVGAADEIERLRYERDAMRYRWLRQRIEIHTLKSLSGRFAPALIMRVGLDYLDAPTRGSRCYSNPSDFWAECEALDAAIDAALAADSANEVQK